LAAYCRDLEYAKHSDTENRNIADRAKLQQLDAIENPSFREKIEMAIVKPIINTKHKFGLWSKDRSARNFQIRTLKIPNR
jgi:hypothetical protein